MTLPGSNVSRVAAGLAGSAAALALAALLASGCAPLSRPGAAGGQAGGATVPTPQTSLSPQVAATAGAVTNVLAASGYRVSQLNRPYRPSEPGSLGLVPRAVFQADVGDPDQGYVVIYEFADAAGAAAGGREMATYLASGFGQTNYPPDAQFSVSQVGATLVFTWWSPDRSSDDARSRGAFEAVGRVGQPIPVSK